MACFVALATFVQAADLEVHSGADLSSSTLRKRRCEQLIQDFVKKNLRRVVQPFQAYHYTRADYVRRALGSESTSDIFTSSDTVRFIRIVANDAFKVSKTNYGAGLYLALDPSSSRSFGFEDRNGPVSASNESRSVVISVRFREGCRVLDVRDGDDLSPRARDLKVCPDLLDQTYQGKLTRANFYKNMIQSETYSSFAYEELKRARIQSTAYPYTSMSLSEDGKSLNYTRESYAWLLQSSECVDFEKSRAWTPQQSLSDREAKVIAYYRGLPQKSKSHEISETSLEALRLQTELPAILNWARHHVASEMPFERLVAP